MDSFWAYYIEEESKHISASYKELPATVLPGNEVTIQVQFSSLNYKDALSARGLNNVTRSYPHIPGIDAAGIVVSDTSGTFLPGDQVVVTGNDLGTNTFGGFGALIKVPVSWVVGLPKPLSLEQSMIIGTAGFTALYGIHRLKQVGIEPESGPVLVTGATGGVGSFAVFALSHSGYEVIAASHKPGVSTFLTALGAGKIISSSELATNSSPKPLFPRRWAGAIETVGGPILDSTLKQIYPKGAVACCGNVLGIELNTNVLPFILRGVSLLGIDSAFCDWTIRKDIWKVASELPLHKLPENYYREVSIQDIDLEIDSILEGNQKGRVVIRHP
ncbi:MAG: acryloyl-CoA reductase [Balneolales bacterium]|nr:acryloyl-CoA reductase [Balneolales bacterium]